MKTILVTGAAGFIGSNLCFKLLEEKQFRIIGLDNLITGTKKNVEDLKKNKKFAFIKHDITKPLQISFKVDEIYNLACPASPIDYYKFPIETLLICSLGVKNVLDFALKNKAKFLHASTSEVYGDPLEHPQKETYKGNVNPIGERSCYDEGKRFAESLIVNYRGKYNLDIKIVRIFNTYGPRMRLDDGRVVSNLIVQAIRGEDLTVYGNGLQTRSFCYVDDLVKGLIKMMKSKEAGPINLGSQDEYSIQQLAEAVRKLINLKLRVVFVSPPKGFPGDDPYKRRPDITLARQKLKWEPKVSLKEGLEKTIGYFRSQNER